ncbi:MAG: CotH kinase family protein, partial [Anaerolineae bacterium]|nr:CotH kinase family protein [Anaerolineae bacterium]
TDEDGAPLLGLARALEASDADLLDALEPHLNLDRFITFWALEVLVDHSDGYTANQNNFYVYFDPDDGGRATFIPWGAGNNYHVRSDLQREPLEIFVTSVLARRLSRIPGIAERFEAELARLLEEVWDEDALLARVDQYAAQVETAEETFGYKVSVDTVRFWIQSRRAEVEDLLAQGLPQASAAPPTCTGRAVPGDFQ